MTLTLMVSLSFSLVIPWLVLANSINITSRLSIGGLHSDRFLVEPLNSSRLLTGEVFTISGQHG